MELNQREAKVLNGLIWNSILTVNGEQITIGEIYNLIQKLGQENVSKPPIKDVEQDS